MTNTSSAAVFDTRTDVPERILLFTGKGGVGKTSIAAAHALASAAEGVPTILVSLDQAHNLGDLFEVGPCPEPRRVSENLDLLEVDPGRVQSESYAHLTHSMAQLMSDAAGGATDLDLQQLPGLDNLYFLLAVLDIHEAGNYRRIILDCAPTGETIALLELPEQISWYLERYFGLEKVAVRVLAPVSKAVFKVELPSRRAMNELEELFGRLQQVRALLTDPTISSVRLVTVPERIVVTETRRNYTYLNLFGYPVDALFINNVYPPDEVNDFFADWVELQHGHIAELRESLGHLPTTIVHRRGTDLHGVGALAQLAAEHLDSHSFDAIGEDARERYQRTSSGYELALRLPLADPADVDLVAAAGELTLHVGPVRRKIMLPDALATHQVTRARRDGDDLIITFTP